MFSPKRAGGQDNRLTYRVQAGGAEAALFLALPKGPVQVALQDVSAGGCGFHVEKAVGKSIRSGDRLRLRMAIGGEDYQDVLARGVVRSIEKRKGLIRVGCEFDALERLYNQLRGEQWTFFNRRSAFRMRPLDESSRLPETLVAPIGVDVENADERQVLLLDEVSASGVSLAFEDEQASFIDVGARLNCQVTLPGGPTAMELVVEVVHIHTGKAISRAGCKIDREATTDSEDKCDALQQFVLDRQRELRIA